jgi:hypothetical protein
VLWVKRIFPCHEFYLASVVLTPEFSDGDSGLGRCNKLLPSNQIRVRRFLLVTKVSPNDRYVINRASGYKVIVIILKVSNNSVRCVTKASQGAE